MSAAFLLLVLLVIALAGWFSARFLAIKKQDYFAVLGSVLAASLVVAIAVAGCYQLASFAARMIQSDLKDEKPPLKVDAKVEFGPDSLKGLSDWGKPK